MTLTSSALEQRFRRLERTQARLDKMRIKVLRILQRTQLYLPPNEMQLWTYFRVEENMVANRGSIAQKDAHLAKAKADKATLRNDLDFGSQRQQAWNTLYKQEAKQLEGQMRKKREKGRHTVESDAFGAARDRMRTAAQNSYGTGRTLRNLARMYELASSILLEVEVVEGVKEVAGVEE